MVLKRRIPKVKQVRSFKKNNRINRTVTHIDGKYHVSKYGRKVYGKNRKSYTQKIKTRTYRRRPSYMR
jgi:DNA/RNA endonuclease YhcR with UshA esterase domain